MAAPPVRRLVPPNSVAKDEKRKKRCTLDSSSSSLSRLFPASVSGVQAVSQSPRRTNSVMRSHSRSFSPAGGSKVLENSSGPIPRQVARVFDEDGNDIAPQPLYQADPGAAQAKVSRFPLLDPYQSRSLFGGSRISSQSTIDSINEDTEDTFPKRDLPVSLPDVRVKKYNIEEQVAEDALEDIINVLISETETITLLDIPSSLVSVEADDAQAVLERNKCYAELCQNKLFNEKYVDQSMQTLNEVSKTKQVQTSSVDMVDKAVIATRWDIWDAFYSPEQEGVAGTNTGAKHANVEKVVDFSTAPEKSVSLGSTTSSGVTPSSSLNEVETSGASIKPDSEMQHIMFSEKFQQCLQVMERAVLLNNFRTELASYRQLPVIEDSDCVVKPEAMDQREAGAEASRAPALQRLWAFSCELVRGQSVTTLTWNKKNENILAVGYGNMNSEHPSPGLVCCWSYKNIVWPNRVIHCDCAVTSLDFSASNPEQLAVGMCNGNIVLYNLQNQDESYAIGSHDCPKRHLGPVWQLKWTEKDLSLTGKEEAETLFSVGADGSVKNWFVHSSGLDCIELLALKKTSGLNKPEKITEIMAGMNVKNPCLCLDFYPTDPSIYLIGTPDGRINKCSFISGRLKSYKQHFRAVNCITFSPFHPDVFLSCSSDRTIQVWNVDRDKPVLSCSSTQASVRDVKWSPMWPSVFGAVNDTQLEIWDLNVGLVDPVIVQPAAPGVRMTALLFAPQTDCVLVGDSEGNVTVYKLQNLNTGADSQADNFEELLYDVPPK